MMEDLRPEEEKIIKDMNLFRLKKETKDRKLRDIKNLWAWRGRKLL